MAIEIDFKAIVIGSLIVSLVIGIVVLAVLCDKLQTDLEEERAKEPEIKQEAILDVQIYSWAENLYDSSEMFFAYWVYNYGDIEARNIKVRCKLFDENDNLRASVLDSFGNVASNSRGFNTVITKNIYFKQEEKFYPICYVESCDNCEVLYKEIPELIELYEKS